MTEKKLLNVNVITSAFASRGREQAVKILEEAAEVFEAREQLDGPDYGFSATDEERFALACEIVDLITAAAGLATAWNLDSETLQKAAVTVNAKNDKRERLARLQDWTIE